jgi:hypothetical protein
MESRARIWIYTVATRDVTPYDYKRSFPDHVATEPLTRPPSKASLLSYFEGVGAVFAFSFYVRRNMSRSSLPQSTQARHNEPTSNV